MRKLKQRFNPHSIERPHCMEQNSCEKSNHRKLIGKSYLISLRLLSQHAQSPSHQYSNQEKDKGGEEKRIKRRRSTRLFN
jgi:hypothetical protein